MVLKDGGLRAILLATSVNLSLKSADEQVAILLQFQNFLNTLDFSVQIVIHSRKMDIRPYLALLNERMEKQETELMRLQLREYISFIQNFIQGADIMTKLFYVIVPFAPAETAQVGKALSGLINRPTATTGTTDSFGEYQIQLEQRMSLVASGLGSAGIRAVPLGTEEIIELLYRSFNVGDMENPIRFT